jgi:Nuclease-related domain
MAGRGHDEGRLCRCDRADGGCAGLAVRRLSPERVWELAEELWTVSSGDLLSARPALADPRSSRAGASAQAAFVRRRGQEREDWRLDWVWLAWGVLGAPPAVGLLLGLTVGAWLGWPIALVVAALAWSRLRFRPSSEAVMWRRQAATQRRTAGRLAPMAEEGWLVLHDVTLPGWLDSLEHLVVGPTGVWVVGSWQRRRRQARRNPNVSGPTAATLRGLRGKVEAIVDLLEGGARVPVRGLVCLQRSWARCPRSVQGVRVATPGQLAQVVRSGSPIAPDQVEWAADRLLALLRPAA